MTQKRYNVWCDAVPWSDVPAHWVYTHPFSKAEAKVRLQECNKRQAYLNEMGLQSLMCKYTVRAVEKSHG